MALIDPTNDLLESFDRNPEKLVKTSGVPLFRSHVRTFPDDTTVTVTDDDLSIIANRINATIENTGRLPTFTLGHRLFGQVNETTQPELLGFHRRFRVQSVTRAGETFKALVADEYAAKDRAAKFDLYRRFPYRSAEYHPRSGYAGAAALMQPPALDLGTVYHYSEAGQDEVDEIDPHAKPAHYDLTMKYMLAHPGMTYYDAEMAIIAVPATGYDETVRSYVDSAYFGGQGSCPDPHVEPEHYQAALDYMRSRPGMDYDSALRHVLGKAGVKVQQSLLGPMRIAR